MEKHSTRQQDAEDGRRPSPAGRALACHRQPRRRYSAPSAEIFRYAAEQGYSSSETGSGFVNEEIPTEVLNLKLMLNDNPTNRNDRYEDIHWNGFGGEDDFWAGSESI